MEVVKESTPQILAKIEKLHEDLNESSISKDVNDRKFKLEK